ncbi:MAG: L-threonylcarbamoyladenylate synthase [bacterium]
MTKWLSGYYEDNIIFAAEIIKKGGLVAFPTETVYGLGANALDKIAVARVFEVKGRPDFDPLIVHIASKEDIYLYAEGVEKEVEKLIDHFWPGPLTIVLPKKDSIPSIVTAGLSTVAIRMPKNPIALKLIKYSGVPIAAPSANPFGYISPTSAFQVADTLYGKIDCILDGGKCEFGLESTVLAFDNGEFYLLRPGALDLETIEKVICKPIRLYDSDKILSPGQSPRHYSPKKNTILIYPHLDHEQIDFTETIKKIYNYLTANQIDSKDLFLILPCKNFDINEKSFGMVDYLSDEFDLKTMASNLFEKLYLADKSSQNTIMIIGVPMKHLGLSIMNRLEKASNIVIR